MLKKTKPSIPTQIHTLCKIFAVSILIIFCPITKVLAQKTIKNPLFSGVFAAGFKGGTYESIANTLNKHPDLSLEIINTSGSSQIIQKVASGRAQIGIAQLDSFLDSSKTNHHENVQILLPLYLEELHILSNKKFLSIQDLKGANISLGAKRSGSHKTGKNLLKTFNIHAKNTHFSFFNIKKSIKKLQDGKIDALFLVSGQPVKMLQEQPKHFGDNIHLLSVPANSFKKVSDTYFHYQSTMISKHSYKWQDSNIQTIGVFSALIGQSKLRFTEVTTILKPLLNQSGQLQQTHAKIKKLNLQTVLYYLASRSKAFHPSAIVYLKSSGLLK